MAIDPRFLASSGDEVFTGNELLVKGALEVEGGVHLHTGYPGSPVAGVFDTLGAVGDLLMAKGVRAFQANNEALAAAAVNGSQMVACRSIATMKNVGLHVAADALALANLSGAHPDGGAMIICGEDPWCDSTQVPADSRYLCQHLRMAVVEPGGPQQVKDWVDLSFKLSQVAGLYVGYIITTAQADGGGTVAVRPNQFPVINTNQRMAMDTAQINLERVLLPPRTWKRELGVSERFGVTMRKARELGVNRIFPAADSAPAPLGFIVTGMGGPYLMHVLADLGLHQRFPILQMGMSYPADAELLREFSTLCRHMIVVEERRGFLESNLREAAFHTLDHDQASDLASRLFGKAFPSPARLNPGVSGQSEKPLSGIPDTRGLYPSVLAQYLIPLIRACHQIPEHLRNGRLNEEMDMIRQASRPKLNVIATEQIVPRTPTFCPGCPHRDSSSVLLEVRKNFADPQYMKKYHGRGPVDLMAHGDTGCYTMLMFAPTEQLMHNYSGMGLGAGTGSGIDPFITNKQIVFMGDGTFFHSGQIAISNAIKAGQDLTFIILENKTTAMTGHQEHAGTELDLLGNRSYLQDIAEIVRGMAGTSPLTVAKLRPDDRSAYKRVLEKTILADGVKVIIADKECGITYHRRELREERKIIKKHGYLPKKTHMNITPEVCEACLECTKQTACPGLTTIDTDYGDKIDTDLTWCVNDGACERVRVSNEIGTSVKPCPSFEQVTVLRNHRRRYTLPHMALDTLPDPTFVHDLGAAGATWRAHLSGVGGMGIGVVGSILVRAGHKQGYRVLFQDKKGLAIRNGGVFAQITFVGTEEEGTQGRRNDGTNGEEEGAEARQYEGAKGKEGAEEGTSTSSIVGNDPTAGEPSPASLAYPTTGTIPYGRADLLLGIDILEASRSIDPREQYRVASPRRTCAVLNLYKQPTVYALLGRQDFDPEALREEIFSHCREEYSYAKNLSELCEQRLGSKQYANIMMLGVAYQLGLIPVSAHAIAWGIKDSIKRDHRKNIKAFNIGRKLALAPRALPRKPEPDTWEQLLTNKTRILRKTRSFGRAASAALEHAVHSAMKQMRDLNDESKYDLALRIYDLMQYQDAEFAKRYIERVRSVYRRDSARKNFAATHAVIWNLAKVMLIKDEVYVSYLLTRYEKKERDLRKYAVDVSNGDRMVYRHHTNPEFNLGPWRIRLRLSTRDWQLNLVRHMKWWRRLPGWHRRETAFRDWYIDLIDRVSLADDAAYDQAVENLRAPEQVSGYREIRYPKQEQVRQAVESKLTGDSKLAADSKLTGDSDAMTTVNPAVPADRRESVEV